MTKVLVVEDSIFIARAIKLILESDGIPVEHISEGSQVVDRVKKGDIDLVILDLMMPGVSGKDVLVMLKNDGKTKRVPVVILTAKTDALKWNKELAACDKFMTKPFDNKELLTTVKSLIAHR